MKYVAGGISGTVGQTLVVEVPIATKPGGASAAAGAPSTQPDGSKPADSAPAGSDKPLPKPIQYAGGNDHGLKRSDGTPFPDSTPGTIEFVKPDKPAQPECWKRVQFHNHSHFLPDNCVDMNASSNKNEYPYGQDIYGPAVPFTPADKFTARGFGGYIGCVIDSGEVIEFGHFDHISAEVYWAAKDKRQLPAGTYLGKCTKTIGLSAGPHCHMQARKTPGGDLLKRNEWLQWMGVPADRVWWPGKK
jgi:hypothetical protein